MFQEPRWLSWKKVTAKCWSRNHLTRDGRNTLCGQQIPGNGPEIDKTGLGPSNCARCERALQLIRAS